MRRRDFLFVIGSAAAAWPMAVRAQDVRRVAYVHALAKDDKRAQAALNVFKTEMQKLGWIEGKNVRYESHWGGKSSGRPTERAKEVVRQAPTLSARQ